MRPENGNTQQMQQELQRKFHGKLFLVVSYTRDPTKELHYLKRKQWAFRVNMSENTDIFIIKVPSL